MLWCLSEHGTVEAELAVLTRQALFSGRPRSMFGVCLCLLVIMLYTCLSGWEKRTELSKDEK